MTGEVLGVLHLLGDAHPKIINATHWLLISSRRENIHDDEDIVVPMLSNNPYVTEEALAKVEELKNLKI